MVMEYGTRLVCASGVRITVVKLLDTVTKKTDTFQQKWKALMAYAFSRSHDVVTIIIPLPLQIRGVHTHGT